MVIRVLQVAKFYPPHAGGIETTTKDIFEVNNNNYVSDVLCFSSTKKTVEESHATGKIIRCATWFSFASMPFSPKYFFHFLKIYRKYDVLHVHHPNPLAFLCVLFASRKTAILLHWHSDILNKGMFYKLFKPFEAAVLKKANVIVTTTPVYSQHSPMLQSHLKKCTYVPSAFDENSLAVNDSLVEDIRKKYGYRKIIFSLGRHVNYKGFHYLIQAAQHLPNDAVVVIGGTGPEFNYHQSLIEELGLTGKVFLPGRIDNNDLGSYYKACDIFCLPSSHKSEAFGLVMVEAMRFSKPVVAANIPASGVSWVNQHGITGLNAENENYISLAENLNILLKDRELHKKFGDMAYRRFKQYFTGPALREAFGNLYKKIIEAV